MSNSTRINTALFSQPADALQLSGAAKAAIFGQRVWRSPAVSVVEQTHRTYGISRAGTVRLVIN